MMESKTRVVKNANIEMLMDYNKLKRNVNI